MKDAWKSYVALGLCVMFILLGFGGCYYLFRKGDAAWRAAEQKSK